MVCSRVHGVFLLLALGCLAGPGLGQEQSSATPQTAPEQTAPSTSENHNHTRDFLIKGTVFTEKALAFPGVQLRIKRAGEKKFRWETHSNSRGEFAVRVPQGADYQLVVHSKGFADQTRAIDAKSGDYEDGIVFRMRPSGGKQ